MTGMRPVQRIRAFFGTMAGQIFLILTLGMSVAAIIALLVAEQARHHDFERVRRARVVASAVDIADRLQRDPARVEAMMANHRIVGAAMAPAGVALSDTDAELESILTERLGRRSQPEAGQVPAGLCFPSGNRERAAGVIDAPRPDCWIVRFTDVRGARRAMALSFPRLIKPPSTIFNPAYLLVIVAASAGLAILVARSVAKPLRRLERAAEAFSLSLDPEEIPERGPEEVRAALSTFNLMQRRARAGFAERTQLLAAISHDLQTPLTRMRLRLELVDNADLRERLLADHQAMQTLVREGLDLASSTESREEWSVIDIDSLLASMAEDAEDLGAPVRFVSGCGGTVRVKPNALTRCIANLVDNGVKYGGGADISCTRSGGRLMIDVRDHGPGIPADQIDQMFEPFTRGPSSQPGGRHGTGIGLTIARSLAMSFEASVRLRNAPEGGVVATIDMKG
ncbi:MULTISPECIES: ATP-binding protein [Sphingobium]|jgi:signal transduction histidine kinase|uniref:histidine kinase n=1 Tax=Sphingobium soli TaxID=1591116 RepID=A0ABS8H5H8_9SPHN|nr:MULTISPECIES: ATP-binding protein [Sphingobium]MBA37677.1 nickel transporter [Sphingobium sp.]MBS49181.1 nickel transporter [Sphingobium sp.]MCC4233318.1 HAMP domain-containing protein [Sphingobium soli]MCC4257160.1 HAMP domain-containing protein [Sphingobium lactosutens]HCW60502.1 nickel transporter [Sphingobium sp.]|tara:strand:- start:3962 stop:5326 length:1365 start_codon:yes stop_codon:yes gene_type:complete